MELSIFMFAAKCREKTDEAFLANSETKLLQLFLQNAHTKQFRLGLQKVYFGVFVFVFFSQRGRKEQELFI